MANHDFADQLRGYSLTTAQILYHMPDHPALIQSYIWQEYDVHPRFPRLTKFLEFWTGNLEGKLYKVLVANRRLLKPSELLVVGTELKLH